MKYKVNGRFRTTIDGRFTIEKDYVLNEYNIRDNESHKYIMETCGGFTYRKCFNKLSQAEAFVEAQYKGV